MGCEGAMEGKIVLPNFTAECESSACKAHSGARTLFVYLTKSSCNSILFDVGVLTGTGTLNCSGGSCQGQVSSWQQRGKSATEMEMGYYSVCAFIDLEGTLPDLDGAGNAAYLQESERFGQGDTSYHMSAWTDIK